ncbi:hypothetical protein GQ53DRAFT_848472 [Thozetella sp. PMI_491]|nr:hypothetical protein GQ53DRAFT_848472 [Thozetella sp. PMI_491]
MSHPTLKGAILGFGTSALVVASSHLATVFIFTLIATFVSLAVAFVKLGAIDRQEASWMGFLGAWIAASLNLASAVWTIIIVAASEPAGKPASFTIGLIILDIFNFLGWAALSTLIGCKMSRSARKPEFAMPAGIIEKEG